MAAASKSSDHVFVLRGNPRRILIMFVGVSIIFTPPFVNNTSENIILISANVVLLVSGCCLMFRLFEPYKGAGIRNSMTRMPANISYVQRYLVP